MALNSKGANLLIKNLAKAGVKVVGKTATVATKLAPLAGAMMVYSEIEKIPGIGHLLKFTRNAQQWVYDKTLGQIPVLGWFTNAASDKLEDLYGVSHPDTRDEWQDPLHKKGSAEQKEETNDAAWYGNVSLPVNINRPMGYHYYQDVFSYPTLGMIPKLNMVVVDLPVFYESSRFKTNVSYLMESMRKNLRSNLTYNVSQLRAFILNNISIYIVAKLLERKLGFLKYKDDQFPEFHELWQYKFRTTESYGVYSLTKNPDYDVNSDQYALNLDIYKSLLDTIFQCILPVNMKSWIDHYFGSVFLLDDDVANKKYSFMIPQTIPFYRVAGNNVLIDHNLTTDQITPGYLYDLCDLFFHDDTHTLMRADIMRQDNLKEKVQVADLTVGWLTSMDSYNPTIVSDPTYKQLIINGYTSNNLVGRDGAIRIDSTTPGLVDVLTSILGLGAVVPYDTTFKVRAMSVKSSSCIFYATADSPVYLPGGFFQQGTVPLYNDIGCTAPTQMVYTSEVSADIYCNVTEAVTGGVNVPIYYPSDQYPTSVPNANGYVMGFTADENIVSDNYRNFRTAMLLYFGSQWEYSDMRLFIPMWHTSDGNVTIFAKSKQSLNGNTPTSAVIRNTSDFLSNFDLVWVSESSTYSGAASAYSGRGVSDILNIEKQIFSNCYVLPVDFAASAVNETVSITNSNVEILIEYNGQYRNFDFLVAQGTPVKFVVTGTNSTPATFTWVPGENILYPSASLTLEYAVITGNISSNELSIVSGFLNYASYLFTIMGYSIPVQPVMRIHKSAIGTNPAETTEYGRTMLKEDFIPYIIRRQDVPAIINDMLSSLTSFKVK